jgi:hypothetical protein
MVVAVATPASICFMLATAVPAHAQAPAVPVHLPTPAEKAGYLSFTAPDEVGPYLDHLAAAGEGVTVDSLPAPTPIPIVRIAPTPRPEAADAGAPGPDGPGPPVVRVLVIGAQHGIERAGIEVGLRIARDLATGRLASLRRGLEVRIVPMANPWGVANRRAETAEGVDMNGDHVRLAAPETRALWGEYVAWRPHLVLDLHELGPSEYTVQIGVPTHPNAPGSAMFARFYLLPFVANELAGSDVRFHEYVAGWSGGGTTEGAVVPTDEDRASGGAWFTPPPLDPTSARNAFALAGSVSYFVAVSSSRDIIGLEERTERLYVTVRALLTAAAGLAPELVAAHEAARRPSKGVLALRPHYVGKRPDASLPWTFENARGQREQGRLAPWRPDVAVDLELEPPAGWWLAPDQTELAEALRAHGFEVTAGWVGNRAAVGGRDPLAYPRCAPGNVDEADAARLLRPVPDGAPPGPGGDALWVSADQPGGRLLFTLVEPWSAGGWFDAMAADGHRAPGPEVCDEAARFPVVRVPR